MKRLFLGLWPDDKTRLQLQQFNGRMSDIPVQPVKANNLHVTLIFIGSVDNDYDERMAGRFAQIQAESFTLVFDQLQYWRKPNVLCLTVKNTPDEAMHLVNDLAACVAASGVGLDPRPYRPHITLARKAKYQPEIEFNPFVWHANSFCMVESVSTKCGVNYQVIQSWKFFCT